MNASSLDAARPSVSLWRRMTKCCVTEECWACCSQSHRSASWQRASFMALLTAAFNGVIVTMISFSPSLRLISRSSVFPSGWQSGGRGGGSHFISFQFILNLLIPCWFCRLEGCLKGGYLRYRHLFLHLLAMCAQNCMKGGGGVKEPRKAGMERQNNNDSLTTRTREKTAGAKSVSDHLPAGMHDFTFLKAAALQKGSCLVSTATKAQPRLYLCAWNVPVCSGAAPEQLTLGSIKGGSAALTSARPHPR